MPPSRQPWLGERETEFPTWDNTLGPSTEDNDLSASSNSEVEFEPEPCERRERDRSVRWNDQEMLAQELSNSNGRAALRIPSGRVFVGDSITQASENDWRPSFSSDCSLRTPQDFRDVFAQVLLQDQHQLDDLVVDFQDAQRCQLRKQMERLKQALAQQRARLLTILEDTLSARPDSVAYQSLSGTPRLEIPSHPSVNSIATSTKISTSPDSTPRVARCAESRFRISTHSQVSADPRGHLTAEEKRETVIALYQRANYAASIFSFNPMLATSVSYVGRRFSRLQQMWEDLVGQKFITRRLRPFVESSMFICAVCGMIVFNAMFIGTTAHFTMQASIDRYHGDIETRSDYNPLWVQVERVTPGLWKRVHVYVATTNQTDVWLQQANVLASLGFSRQAAPCMSLSFAGCVCV